MSTGAADIGETAINSGGDHALERTVVAKQLRRLSMPSSIYRLKSHIDLWISRPNDKQIFAG
jgi:hypothetical protein